MTPDLYAAWLAAVVILAVIGWALWPTRSDYRSRNDQRAAVRVTGLEERPEPAAPGQDVGLYLDCVAIYSDCDELDRLRDLANQNRTGEK
jgi:hypothetical protein